MLSNFGSGALQANLAPRKAVASNLSNTGECALPNLVQRAMELEMEVELEIETYPQYAWRLSTICLLVVSIYFYPSLCQVMREVSFHCTVDMGEGFMRV
jgi:hypothetical protein